MGVKSNRAHVAWRSAACAVMVVAALSVSGCSEIQDIQEEMGWAEPPPTPPPAPAAPSLESHWITPEIDVEGVTQAQWSARWWQWAARFPRDSLPVLDSDGRQCAEHQEGPVWFLAGTDGSFDAVRKCKIPAGKYLFVPLINSIKSSAGLQKARNGCAQMQTEATEIPDHVTNGLVLLDGRPVGEFKRMRVASGACFNVGGSMGGGMAASDGYWLMLKPLPPGQHVLAISAAYRNGPRQILQNFQYQLEVEGAPGSAPPPE